MDEFDMAFTIIKAIREGVLNYVKLSIMPLEEIKNDIDVPEPYKNWKCINLGKFLRSYNFFIFYNKDTLIIYSPDIEDVRVGFGSYSEELIKFPNIIKRIDKYIKEYNIKASEDPFLTYSMYEKNANYLLEEENDMLFEIFMIHIAPRLPEHMKYASLIGEKLEDSSISVKALILNDWLLVKNTKKWLSVREHVKNFKSSFINYYKDYVVIYSIVDGIIFNWHIWDYYIAKRGKVLFVFHLLYDDVPHPYIDLKKGLIEIPNTEHRFYINRIMRGKDKDIFLDFN